MDKVTIIGGGLAGCEAALQLAARDIPVEIWEMRPEPSTEAHQTDGLAELVCSNSFRGDSLRNAVGLIKEEMRRAGSVLMQIAEETKVPAGGALAVDRERFSAAVTARIEATPNIVVKRGVRESLPPAEEGPCIVATGPLTHGALAADIMRLSGEDQLYFYDAIAPIIEADSIDMDIVFAQSRYDKGDGADYLNCPMDEVQYKTFVQALRDAELAPAKAFEETKFFDACLPVEVMAGRGDDVLAFGPMKPVGLNDPRREERPYAVVQLRTENIEKTAYNMVGFQTRVKWGHQKTLFRSIPGLENAVFLRFGTVHRNTFINGPKLLNPTFGFLPAPHIRFAGQITGVEGYVESTAIGLLCGMLLAADIRGVPMPFPPATTALGALRRHVTGELQLPNRGYQPTNVNWSMMPSMKKRSRKRAIKRLNMAERALEDLDTWLGAVRETRSPVDGFRKNEIEAAWEELRSRPPDKR